MLILQQFCLVYPFLSSRAYYHSLLEKKKKRQHHRMKTPKEILLKDGITEEKVSKQSLFIIFLFLFTGKDPQSPKNQFLFIKQINKRIQNLECKKDHKLKYHHVYFQWHFFIQQLASLSLLNLKKKTKSRWSSCSKL